MSSPATFTNVSWCPPDGRPIITHLTLAFDPGRTGLVGRNGVGKTTLLKLISGELRPQSGQVAVSGRFALLPQTAQLDPHETVADRFGVAAPWALFQRAVAGEAGLEELAEVDWSLEGRILAALGGVGLEARPETRLSELSGGQRTRASLAAVLFAEPDFLLLDEPTNNLDREGRTAVLHFLARWKAGAIVVSHDRELLETMDAIVELTSLGATRYGGNWSFYRERRAAALSAARHDLATAEKHVTEVARSAQITAERKARKDGAGQRKSAQGGLPRILLNGRKDRSEDTGGAQARLAERRRTEAAQAATAARERLEVIQPLAVVLPPTNLPIGRTVLEIDAVSAGYEPGRPILRDFSLTLTGPERVAILGRNGSGKTTLLRLITGQLSPWAGTVRVSTEYAVLDQQVRFLDPALSIRDNFRRLNREPSEQACRASLARFMFRAEAALQIVGTLSGGQLLRAGLACVLGRATPPPFLILDEPTNHLDLDSIGAVETGLRAYDGALLVVSHDEAFLREIGIERRVEFPGLVT